MLEQSVAGHHHRGDHAHANNPLHLLALSHHCHDRYTQHDVGEGGVGALHALVRTPEACPRYD